MSVTQVKIPATIIPQRKIGEINTMCVFSEMTEDRLEVTKHPVQQGAEITDHAYKEPERVTIDLAFDDEHKPLIEQYNDLLKIQTDRIPIDIVTGKRIHKNMMLTSINQVNDPDTENILKVTIELQRIIITNLTLSTVPPRAVHRNPERTGGTVNSGQKTPQEQDGDGGQLESIFSILVS